jgi:hypothetical protein
MEDHMSVARRVVSVLIALGAIAYAAACRSGHEGGSSGPRTTRVTMEIRGGFKYVHSPENHMLEVAFLNSTTGDCKVEQLGVKLTVVEGLIVDPLIPPLGNTFNPDGAVLHFGDNPDEVLTVQRGDRPVTPFHPPRPKSDASWKDLKWVPSVSSFYPDHPLNPDWRSLPVVNGRVVLTHGTLVGIRPSDDRAVTGLFKFQRESDGATFTQAMTDRTIYTARVPGDRLIITLDHPTSAPQRIEIKPIGNRPVKLVLVGLHDDGHVIHPNEVVKHYCSYYELLSSPPPMSQRLLPVYIGDPQKPPLGQPSPGAYCSGEFN